MFPLGSAVPNDRARLLLQKVAPVLMRLTAGHLDRRPHRRGAIRRSGPHQLGAVGRARQCDAAAAGRCRPAGGAHPQRDRQRRPRPAAAERPAGRRQPPHRHRGAARRRTRTAAGRRRERDARMLTIGGLRASCSAACSAATCVSGGSIDALIEALPFEMWTIGGAAIGTFVMANSMHDLKHTLGGFGRSSRAPRSRRPTTSTC